MTLKHIKYNIIQQNWNNRSNLKHFMTKLIHNVKYTLTFFHLQFSVTDIQYITVRMDSELMVWQVHSKIEDPLTKLKKPIKLKPVLENNI